ncbi:hypothetical protein FCM44_02450 [Mycoplasma bovis]|uniref:Putative membrane protein n=1 Tax=Mycoplasmopsis bovis (strain ATCC 25523 / DSM 22781 / NCTC 10131 / PG45) TaxID=289397 RepID=A0A454AQ83_MYCBG|nr:hypothetical protein [Mycoplasmopsis bovis]ADR25215.1 putative membrane protein [Mycoplasmopsis bovis PG45]MBT1345461.1 hypothetical protein [Mycoplasmopsis bovis]MBT1367647.1 hypothetical protein [Mycoplasmopsis bovis]MBT1368556.1 hypothetical protein [Mycoplasmopsis bovis]MBT1369428.1 hypothetical protein [Mycoplasmopsis bovis]
MRKQKEVKLRIKGFILLTIFLLMSAAPLIAYVFLAKMADSNVWIIRFVNLTANNIKKNFVGIDGNTSGIFVNFYKTYFSILSSDWSKLGISDIILIIMAFVGSQLFLILSVAWLLYVFIVYCVFNLFKGKVFILYALISLLLFVTAGVLYGLLYFGPVIDKTSLKVAIESKFIIFVNKWLIWILTGVILAQTILICVELATVKRVNSNLRVQTLEMQ